MKKIFAVHVIPLVFLGTLLTAGCARTPATVPLTSAGEAPANQTVRAPEAVPAEVPISEQQPVKEALPVALERIHFAFDQFALSAEARDSLAGNAVLLQISPDLKVIIEGHCDSRGSDEYNLALGERRAKAARDFLVSLGVASDRLETISYGEELPLDLAANEQAWAKNRRAELKPAN
jgi:peptidoglycan-associated lipoprotein